MISEIIFDTINYYFQSLSNKYPNEEDSKIFLEKLIDSINKSSILSTKKCSYGGNKIVVDIGDNDEVIKIMYRKRKYCSGIQQINTGIFIYEYATLKKLNFLFAPIKKTKYTNIYSQQKIVPVNDIEEASNKKKLKQYEEKLQIIYNKYIKDKYDQTNNNLLMNTCFFEGIKKESFLFWLLQVEKNYGEQIVKDFLKMCVVPVFNIEPNGNNYGYLNGNLNKPVFFDYI